MEVPLHLSSPIEKKLLLIAQTAARQIGRQEMQFQHPAEVIEFNTERTLNKAKGGCNGEGMIQTMVLCFGTNGDFVIKTKDSLKL